MALTKQQARSLVDLIAATRDEEIDCGTCLTELAVFAEMHIEGRPLDQAREAVRAHLAFCGECGEEFEHLLAAIEAISDQAAS